MPHSTPLRLLLALGLALVPAFAAKPKSVPADSPPQLISTKGGGPKWKNVAELQAFAANGDPLPLALPPMSAPAPGTAASPVSASPRFTLSLHDPTTSSLIEPRACIQVADLVQCKRCDFSAAVRCTVYS